jgi:hypothetical protein
MTKITDRFIKLHVITSSPENEVRELYQRVDEIHCFAPAAPEYARIGAASTIDVIGNRYIMVTESTSEIYEALSKIDLLP